MGGTAYRRRLDGVVEIVRPSARLRDLAVAVGITAAVLGFFVALAVALAFYVIMGVPLALAGLLFLATRLSRRRRSRRERTPRATAPLAPVERIRRAPIRTVQPPVLERGGDARGRRLETRGAPRSPPGDGAVVISIPGTAASRRE